MSEQTSSGWYTHCPICRIMAAAEHQQISVAVLVIEAASKMRCRCPTRRHPVLGIHPHRAMGCMGFHGVEPAEEEA